MTIYEQIIEVCKDKSEEILTSAQIKSLVSLKFGTKEGSIIISDYCYNRTNRGINFNHHLFHYISRNEYRYLGENYNYSGEIYWKPRNKDEIFVGIWDNAKYIFFKDMLSDNVFQYTNGQYLQKNLTHINTNQITKLYEEYMRILELEINIFGLKPTEVRHLIGRIGEFKCAILTNGILAHEVNQHGFDVIANNKKISVKTTAQISGFVSININTIHHVDELMLFQYINKEFKVIYHGDIQQVIQNSTIYNSKYEFKISIAKKTDI